MTQVGAKHCHGGGRGKGKDDRKQNMQNLLEPLGSNLATCQIVKAKPSPATLGEKILREEEELVKNGCVS
jgi:hypothetical protein